MAVKNPLLWTYIVVDILVLLSGLGILATVLVTQMSMKNVTLSNVAQNILLMNCPLTAGIVDAIMIFITFLASVPALIVPSNRLWLKIHGWLLVVSAIFTLVLGLDIWFDTLKNRAHMSVLWAQQTPHVQSLLQQHFHCCGFQNSTTFQKDALCTGPLIAATLPNCQGKFSSFGASFLDLVFTADFGIVALDVILLLCVAMVLKDRKERERYKLIDAKNGFAI